MDGEGMIHLAAMSNMKPDGSSMRNSPLTMEQQK